MAVAIDAGRFAARNLGRHLVEAGAIDEVEDVFQLTLGEALAEPASNLRDRVQQRKSGRARDESLDLPRYRTGDPEPVEVAAPAHTATSELIGIPGASGVAEGRV